MNDCSASGVSTPDIIAALTAVYNLATPRHRKPTTRRELLFATTEHGPSIPLRSFYLCKISALSDIPDRW